MTQAVGSDPAAVLAAARSLAPSIAACRDAIEERRGIPDALFDEMRAAGMFRLLTPHDLGGLALTMSQFMSVVEEVAKADGSAGWTVSVSNSGFGIGYLPPATAAAIYGKSPDVTTAGAFPPAQGRAIPVEGGYRLSGRWRYVSGCEHADWFQFGAIVTFEDGSYRRGPGGLAETRRFFVPRSVVEVLDTWRTSGLRGSGSHDCSIADAFVAEDYTRAVAVERAYRDDTLYHFPPNSFLGLGFTSVGLGVARHALETLKDLAGAKKPTASRDLLRERITVQADVARAEAMLRSARGFLHEMVDALWADAETRRQTPDEQRALLRAAIVNAATTSAQVVDLMYNAGGGTSIHEVSPLERCFRDIHAVTQQIMLAPERLEVAGRVLLGMEAGFIY